MSVAIDLMASENAERFLAAAPVLPDAEGVWVPGVLESDSMSAPRMGRIVGERIELDGPVEGLDGKRVRVTLEVVEPDEHPVGRAIREAPVDDRPMTRDERASIDESKRDGRSVTSAEIRAKLIARTSGGG